MELTGKNVLITGASSGLGRSIALELARRGNKVAVTARREKLLEEISKEIESIGGRCVVCAADSIVTQQSLKVVETVLTAFGHIDLAILNAGGGVAMSMAEATSVDVLGLMRTNYDTLVNYLCPMIEHMKSRGGVIAYTGSPVGYFGLPKSGPYSAAKAAGRNLIDTCRIELAKSNVRFVAMYPGFTYTDGLDPNDVPVKALIINTDRAVKEMIYAIEREIPHHIFPKRIKFLITLARLIPEPGRRTLLSLFS